MNDLSEAEIEAISQAIQQPLPEPDAPTGPSSPYTPSTPKRSPEASNAQLMQLDPTTKKAPTKSQEKHLQNLPVHLEALLGQARLPISEVLKLSEGSVIPLDTLTAEPILLLAEGKPVAEGEIVVIEDHFGFRLTKLFPKDDPLSD